MILVDIGNTRLKWAQAGSEPPRDVEALAHEQEDWLPQLGAHWRSLRADSIWIAAVAREDIATAVVELARTCLPQARVHRIVPQAQAAGLWLAYDEPQRLGVDRYLALLAVWRAGIAPALIASLGTALAVDALDAQGRHLGGLIAPSPRLMRDAVLGRTARVGWQREGRAVGFGTSTEDGLESGCWSACAGAVERARRDMQQRVGTVPRVLLTGGDAGGLAALLPFDTELRPELVLEGLWRHARLAAA